MAAAGGTAVAGASAPGALSDSESQDRERNAFRPKIFDIANDDDAERFGLSTTRRTGNSGNMTARDFMLSRRITNRNGGSAKFIVLHIQEGRTAGSLEHWVAGRKFKEGKDVGPVTASATVMIQKDGSILRVIPEKHGPWTNGKVDKPTAQSKKLRDLGPDPNRWCLTIEAEGKPNDAMPRAQLQAVLWQVRTWMKRYDIPEENILPHSSIDSVDRGHCPGPYYKRVLKALDVDVNIDDDVFAKPSPPPPFDGTPKKINGVAFHPFKKTVTSLGVKRRQWATTDAEFTGPSIPAGETFNVLYWIKGEEVDGNGIWLIGESGSRIWSGGIRERVPTPD